MLSKIVGQAVWGIVLTLIISTERQLFIKSCNTFVKNALLSLCKEDALTNYSLYGPVYLSWQQIMVLAWYLFLIFLIKDIKNNIIIEPRSYGKLK